jgi:predicted ATPase
MFIDWSDPEDMFQLLLEYVGDERSATVDAQRRRFLAQVARSLGTLQERFASLDARAQLEALRELRASAEADFETDDVVQHLDDCVAELERLYHERS